MSSDAYKYIARFLVLFLAIPVHESAHAYVSYRLGDPTAKNMGRLTLNPLKHFDLMGCISMLVVGIGWAKPVPIDPRYYKDPKKGMALSALAGPVSNLLMAFVGMIFYKISFYSYYASSESQVLYYVTLILQTMVLINISLAIFNMMPVPPFDGSRILGVILPERMYFGIMKYERYIFFAMFALLFLGVFDKPLYYANNALFDVLNWLTKFVDSIVLSFLR
ncbi:MAG: site-2 protease family protein, partial [Oscillospiraceae bacterium]